MFEPFLPHDQIRITQAVELLVGDLPQDADRQARAGEGMAADDLLRQAQGTPHLAHFVLEQLTQRFHQLELQILGQTAHVVVALDLHRHPLTGLGIDVGTGALDHIIRTN